MDDVHCLDTSDSLSPVPDETINISDVIEVIETDPDFQQPTPNRANMYRGPSTSTTQEPRKPYVRIREQPAGKALRFRYECEGRSAGSIPGVNSTTDNKTFPSIEVVGHRGRAVVVVSCVTKDKPYKPHPHNLVGREGCKKGVCTLEIPPETMSIAFSNLGIQCVKKKDIEAHLKVREDIRVDPFRTGFQHRSQPTSIDLNAVRLCFQVFIESPKTGKPTYPLDPIVSDPIYDKKAMSDLTIVKLSHCVSPVDGGRNDIILLCEKVLKEDIKVRFYEVQDGKVVWEDFGDFQPSQVHKQMAIWFRTPKYKTLEVTEPVKVFIQLQRPSDGAVSEPLPFELLPLDSGIRRKRKYEPNSNASFLRPLQERDNNMENNYNIVKLEPVEAASPPYVSPHYARNPSPMFMPDASISPHQLYISPMPVTVGLTTAPTQDIQYNFVQQQQQQQQQLFSNVLPSISNVLPASWNIPSTSGGGAECTPSSMQMECPANLSSLLLNLDNHQLQPISLNSDELPAYYDANNLSEHLSNNLSLNDDFVQNAYITNH